MTSLDEMREEFNETMGWPKDTNKELDRMDFGENYEWVRRRCYDALNIPTWYAVLVEKED